MTERAATPVNSPLPLPDDRRRLRESAGVTREDLAAALGVGLRTVRSWESGRSTPRGRVREAYAHLLGGWAAGARGAVAEAARGSETSPAAALGSRPSGARGGRTAARAVVREPEREPEPEHERAPEAVPEPGPERPAEPEPGRAPDGEPEPDHSRGTAPVRDPGGLTPARAFELLHAHAAPGLLHQTYLLTGRPALAAAAVQRAFHTAWERWPEVARDPDPVGWVRAAAHDHALSPWHRLRPVHARADRRRGRGPEAFRALLRAVGSLPPPYRRTLLLVDLVGLGLPETAAETEASTPAAVGRLAFARTHIATALPDLRDPAALRDHLAAVPLPSSLAARGGEEARLRAETRTLLRTRGALGLAALVTGATCFTLATAPPPGQRPLGPTFPVAGGTAQVGRPGPDALSPREEWMRAHLRGDGGRLTPSGV
ncbi:helix-turn-helix domain-containing protein [Streptomyces sp. NPDC060194]|uniref:helix-turn-helix domain-containing protein n=1 Tax=Streptomyces sp. NPDC060194 TaxID=3347069 RepID=UPI0036509CEC